MHFRINHPCLKLLISLKSSFQFINVGKKSKLILNELIDHGALRETHELE